MAKAITMAERVATYHEIALVLLGQSPAQFWRSTPAETHNQVVAYRRRTNLRLMQRAWEVYQLMRVHVGSDSGLTLDGLFRSMPGAFPADLPAASNDSGMPAGLNPRQEAEWRRRASTKRVLSPRTK